MDSDSGTMGNSSVLSDGTPPSDRDLIKLAQSTDKALILDKHDVVLPEQKNKMNSETEADWVAKFGSISFKRVAVDQASGPPAPVQLTPANRVGISSLTQNPNKVIDGKYFLCRTIAPSYRFCAIEAIVEDPNGQQGIRLSLYNYSSLDKCSYEDLLEEIPVGQILAIKNPCFKSKDSWIKERNGEFFLKCDNPEDVAFISGPMAQELFPGLKWDGEIPDKWRKFIQSTPKTSIEWKNQGNQEFLRQKYEKAIQSYTEGLNLKVGAGGDTYERITCDMLSNRAAAYLKLECFQSAFTDAEKLLEINPTHFKGLYRKGKALLGLQRFQEAIEFLGLLSNIANSESENKMFMELLKLAENCLKQQNTGEYDFLKLYKAGQIRHNDYGDYVGPVKVQNVIGSRSGRGLVATQVIQPGQLILATKAFQIVFPAEVGPCPDANSVRQKLVEGIVQKLTLEPNLCRTFYQLYAGPDLPIFDAEKHPLVVDLNRIEGIRRYNSYVANMPDFKATNWPFAPRPLEPLGIWTMSSFMNHRCWDINAIWGTFGDMLFLRALKEIQIGEEILISYCHPTSLYEYRNQFLMNNGLVCECRLCQIDRDDSKEGQKRMELLKEIDKEQKEQNGGFEIRMERMMKKIWDLDKNGQKPDLKLNPSLIEPLHHMGLFFFTSKNYKKTVDILTKRHALSTNSAWKHMAMETCFQMISVHLELGGNVEEAKRWTKTLKNEMMTLYGTLDFAEFIDSHTLGLMRMFNIFLQ